VAQNHHARKVVSATLSVLKWSVVIFWPRSSTPSVRSFYLCPFHWKLRPSGVSLESYGLENMPQLPTNRSIVPQNQDARKAVSSTLSLLKWNGATFRPRSSTPSVLSFYLCPFQWKLRPSGVSLESPGLEKILQVQATRAKVSQNHDARKPVSSTLLVLKWSRAIFRPRSSTPSVHSFYLSPFQCVLRASGGSLEFPEMENIPQEPANQVKVAQNHDGLKAVSASFSVWK